MDEHFLSKFREAPRPEFAETLCNTANTTSTLRTASTGVRHNGWRLPGADSVVVCW